VALLLTRACGILVALGTRVIKIRHHLLIYLNYRSAEWGQLSPYHLKDSVAFGLAEFDDD
jgi:hypothetical protein